MLFRKLVCAAFLACVCSAIADSPSSTLKGVVTDPEGAGISDARILIHWDPSGADVGLTSNVGLPSDLSIKTNNMGEFTTQLPPGFYDVFVSALAFTPDCRKIRVMSGKTAIFDSKIRFDPLVTKELGFEIPMGK